MNWMDVNNALCIQNYPVKEYSNKRGYLDTGGLTGSIITQIEFYSFDKKPSRANQNVSAGDIILARMQGTNKVKIIENSESSLMVSTGFLVLKSNENYDKKFLFHLLTSEKFQREKDKLCSGATQKAINNTNFQKLKILSLPLATQKKIATILDKADELRQNDKKILEKYDQLAQSVFLEMFGDPVLNEKGWVKDKLFVLGKVKTGNTPPRDIADHYGNYIEWIKTDNINTPFMILTKAEECLSEKGFRVGRSVESGSILVTCIAGSRGVIGNAALSDRKVCFNQQINAFVPKTGIPVFYYFQFTLAKRYVQSFSTNSMKGMISKGKFEQIEFIAPPIDLQIRFAEIIKQIENQKQLTQQSLQKSEELFQSLLHGAFRGELVG